MGFRVKNLGQATGVQPTKQRGEIVEANRVAKEQVAEQAAQIAEYNKKLAEQMKEQQDSAERTQVIAPPDAQDLSNVGDQRDRRVARSSSRGSLLAGNTGGYNPATGGGRLGGRGLLG